MKREYGGLRTDRAKRLKDLEKENARLKPTHRNHVWSYDFVMDRTSGGRAFWMLTIVDEFARECLANDVARKLTSEDVLERLSDLLFGVIAALAIGRAGGADRQRKCDQ